MLIFIAFYVGLGQPLNAQPLQKHNNSLRLQLGVFQYNGNNNDFLFQNENSFLSAGLTYRRDVSRIFAINITGRYNEWNMNQNMDLQTYAFQALWGIHTYSISSSWRTNRIIPYAGVGIGYENHNLKTLGKDTTFQRAYIPFEIGVLFNLNPRWSIGLFSEYKLASVSPIDNLLEAPKLRLDLSNIAGVSLSYRFGSNKKEQSVPIIITNQSIVQNRVLKEKVKDSSFVFPKRVTHDTTLVVLGKDDVDSTIVLSSASINDSTSVFPVEEHRDSTNLAVKEEIRDSSIKVNDSIFVDKVLLPDSIGREALHIPETHDSLTLQKKSVVVLVKPEAISDTIRVPVVLDISVNMEKFIMDSKYTAESASRIEPTEKAHVSSPAPVYEIPNQQLQSQLGQIDNNLLALQDQYKIQNQNIDSELKKMKIMLGALNAELLILTAAKTITRDGEVKYVNLPSPALKTDSLLYLIDSIYNQRDEDSVRLSLVNTNTSLLNEVKKLQSENKELADKLARLSKVADSKQISDSLDNVVYTINFEVNSTKVDIGQLFKTKTLIDLLKTKPDRKILLSGYADKSGNAKYNLSLSKKRVQAVKEELIKMGVNKNRIMEQYFGSEKATATNNQNDRKVELKVLKSF